MSTPLPPLSSFLPPPSPSHPLTLPFSDQSNHVANLAASIGYGGGAGAGAGPLAKPRPGSPENQRFRANGVNGSLPPATVAPSPPSKLPPIHTHGPMAFNPSLSRNGPSSITSPVGDFGAMASGSSSSPHQQLNGNVLGSPSSVASSTTRANPLSELIDTERVYVQDLSLIIKKVAAAYSRHNFPPPHLDKHFRLAEGIYRANKGFLAELNAIGGTEPKSPKALGDLLMRWVDELATPYGKYVNGWSGAGGWTRDPVTKSNPSLQPILDGLPWPTSVPEPPIELFPGAPNSSDDTATFDPQGDPHASLTTFFALPYARLGYYKRLYGKLLKSTAPGRTDHRILSGAQEKISQLLDEGQARWSVWVDGVEPLPPPTALRARPTSPPLPRPPLSSSGPFSSAPTPAPAPAPAPPTSSAPFRPIPSPIRTEGLQKPLPTQLSAGGGDTSPGHTAALAAIAAARERSPILAQGQLPSAGGDGEVRRKPRRESLQQAPPGARVPSESTSRESASGSGSHSSIPEDQSLETGFTTPASASSSTEIGIAGPSKGALGNHIEVAPGIVVERRVLDLERRLDTTRCLDIFSMKPKKCKLQMAPANLAFSRSLRYASDASFSFFPTCDPGRREVRTPRARLILLTDLLIFCEYMTDEDRAGRGGVGEGREFWLMYPPLAGRHLRVEPSRGGSDREGWRFEVVVMKKERVAVTVATRESREIWLRALNDAIDYGNGSTQATPRPGPRIPSPVNSSDPRHPSLTSPPGSLNDHSSPPPPRGGPPGGPGFGQQQMIPQQTQPLRIDRTGRLPPVPPPGQGGLPSGPSPYGHPIKKPSFSSSGGHGPPLQQQRLPRSGGTSPAATPSDESFRLEPSPSPRYYGSSPGSSNGHPGLPPTLPPGHGPPGQGLSSSYGPGPLRPVQGQLRKTPSSHSLGASSHGSWDPRSAPPIPPGLPPNMDTWRSTDTRGGPYSDGFLTPGVNNHGSIRSRSTEPHRDRHYQKPSAAMADMRGPRSAPGSVNGDLRDADGDSDGEVEREADKGPKTSILAATMRTKVFLKQSHSQWKALGTAKLKVFVLSPGNEKQLVVEGDKGNTMISTIVVTDGVERVGRTGVAVDLSDNGVMTGIVYMLQMKNEKSATGLFEQLLQGSDRRSGTGR